MAECVLSEGPIRGCRLQLSILFLRRLESPFTPLIMERCVISSNPEASPSSLSRPTGALQSLRSQTSDQAGSKIN